MKLEETCHVTHILNRVEMMTVAAGRFHTNCSSLAPITRSNLLLSCIAICLTPRHYPMNATHWSSGIGSPSGVGTLWHRAWFRWTPIGCSLKQVIVAHRSAWNYIRKLENRFTRVDLHCNLGCHRPILRNSHLWNGNWWFTLPPLCNGWSGTTAGTDVVCIGKHILHWPSVHPAFNNSGQVWRDAPVERWIVWAVSLREKSDCFWSGGRCFSAVEHHGWAWEIYRRCYSFWPSSRSCLRRGFASCESKAPLNFVALVVRALITPRFIGTTRIGMRRLPRNRGRSTLMDVTT